ncbi:MAG TPA: bifunctional lysylphosphatidylglycerol flippase/synthetase MprF [Pirellulales bacterium]|jgi:phosphatidylglycerol lysyltransferase|nr:bifunctional lysylphosphatidylglycerol flippase/synthetase MprF [Pirellulales bacterium]
MNRFLRFLGPLFALVVFALAIWALRRELRHIHYHEVRTALLNIPRRDFLTAVALTALNYVVLLAYDWVSVRYLRLPLGMGKTALASFIGHVSSFNFGAVLGGTPVRYRLYTAFGLSGGDVLKLIALSTATFWLGFLALAGVMFLWDPLTLPSALHMPFRTTTPIGWLLVALTLVYLGMSYMRVTLRWHDWEFTLPPLWLSLVQLAIAATDLLIASAVLHVLLPHSMHIAFGEFLGIYLLAVVTVLFTHVPAGAGVLEFVMLLLLAPARPAALLGSMLAFRVVYYLLPLALAMVLLAGHELAIRRHAVGRITTAVGRWAPAVAPPLLSLVVVLAGASLLFAGAMPAAHGRLEWLNAVLPLGVIEGAHLLGSVCGLMLVILARGLQLRLDSAYWLSIVVLIGAILCSLAREFDVEQAMLLSAVLVVLLPCRPYFYRHAALLHEPFSPGWLAAIGAIIIATGWLTAFSFQHVEYSDQLWWKVALKADAPRSLRAGMAVALAAVVLSLAHLLRAVFPKPRPPGPDEMAWARQIVAASGRAAANAALTGDKWFLFNASHTALVMYRVHHRLWIALGDPVGPASERTEMAWQFRDLAEHFGASIAFCGVDNENLPLYLDMGLWPLQLGEEARVRLADFSLAAPRRAALAQTHERLRTTCQFEVVPAAQVPPLVDRLRVVSDAYLVARHATEHGFLSGFFDPQYLAQFPLAVVHSENRIVAFANLWPAAGREELAVDVLRFPPTAPVGIQDFLLAELMLWARAEGYAWFNLGLAPSAGAGEETASTLERHVTPFPLWSGAEEDNPRQTRQFKDQFDPVWTPRFLVSPGGVAPQSVLAHLAALVERNPLHKK